MDGRGLLSVVCNVCVGDIELTCKISERTGQKKIDTYNGNWLFHFVSECAFINLIR